MHTNNYNNPYQVEEHTYYELFSKTRKLDLSYTFKSITVEDDVGFERFFSKNSFEEAYGLKSFL